MKNILLPTDFSANAWNATQYAIEIVKKTGATLTLFNVAQMPPGNTTMHRSIKDILKKDSETALAQLKKSVLAAHPDLPVEIVSRYGDLIVQTTNLLREKPAHLIVMGTEGAAGIKEILLGSNTAHFIEQVTSSPVLAVPHRAVFSGIRRIVFATSYTSNNLIAARKLWQFAQVVGASVHLLHVRTPRQPSPNPAVELFKQRLNAELPEASFTFHEVENEDILDGLNDFVEAEQMNMIAMVARKKGFFESFMERSLVKTVAFHTETPLLAYHDASAVN